ncbi:MAG TPA: Hsp20/alpha crystallin family protein [Gaiellales bacterium]|nr:Hsp20/alpha crystallin family protein [Gaiellales bacterium]
MATLTRWDPFQQMRGIEQEIDRMFGRVAPATRMPWTPAADVKETDDAVIFHLDLPGLERDDVNVELHDRTLTISGERREEHEEHDRGYHIRERSYGRFARSFTLPEGVTSEQITATFAKGVLEVTVPRPVESVSHRIEIAL